LTWSKALSIQTQKAVEVSEVVNEHGKYLNDQGCIAFLCTTRAASLMDIAESGSPSQEGEMETLLGYQNRRRFTTKTKYYQYWVQNDLFDLVLVKTWGRRC